MLYCASTNTKLTYVQDISRFISALDTASQLPSLLLLYLKMCLNMPIASMSGAYLAPWTICIDAVDIVASYPYHVACDDNVSG